MEWAGGRRPTNLWAELVILQFPLWWFSMPAIMKGWIDRTFANGLAYGLKDPAHPHLSLRYGAGGLQGRRSILVVTASGREAALGPRGIGGHIGRAFRGAGR
jgi:NAD(P)H dehydrogenase (quinone)